MVATFLRVCTAYPGMERRYRKSGDEKGETTASKWGVVRRRTDTIDRTAARRADVSSSVLPLNADIRRLARKKRDATEAGDTDG